MISYDKAIQIATAFAEEIDTKFPGKIEAVFAIGSLGSDYYRPGQSDIDTAVVTCCTREEVEAIREQIEEIADRYWHEYEVPKGFGAIVFAKEQLYPPYIKEEELILEILRLQKQSKLLWGNLDVMQIPVPDQQAIINDAINFQEWSDSQPPFEHTVTTMVNSTLIALKRYLMIQCGIVEFNKFKVIDLYMQNEPPIVFEELFSFIQKVLRGEQYEWDEQIRIQYTEWHDEVYRVINEMVLYQ